MLQKIIQQSHIFCFIQQACSTGFTNIIIYLSNSEKNLLIYMYEYNANRWTYF